MASPASSTVGQAEAHELKTEVHTTSVDVPGGEDIGHRPEDHDLSQFGYKAELQVSDSKLL